MQPIQALLLLAVAVLTLAVVALLLSGGRSVPLRLRWTATIVLVLLATFAYMGLCAVPAAVRDRAVLPLSPDATELPRPGP
jgi:bacteriorhodopsin